VPEPDRTAPVAGPDATGQPANRSSIGSLINFASQTAVITAILFYFGWARSRATYAYFGVDTSTLNFSVSDYVLRSVDAILPVLIAAGFLAATALFAHNYLRPRLSRDAVFAARLGGIVAAAGWLLAAVGLFLALVIVGTGGSAPPGPALMAIGFVIVVYSLLVSNRYGKKPGTARLAMVAAALAILALFWAVGAYADWVGVRVARQFQASLPTQPNVTIYSGSALSLGGPGVREATLPSAGTYHFRYDGLRLLVSSGGDYFLLPARWQPGDGAVIVLPVNPAGLSIRVEFSAPRGEPSAVT